ncbi:hypothetical protein DPEC_G00173390 [Dallia pectoralis]|uniref:Uncharacterized protein n=1 Tax=Dallia pectoralis TaxID=75939 RepID=A0ACC2GE80_DALPE|nr:hypothetical protein DPEC_G00173390 [Dallia pectoralis]
MREFAGIFRRLLMEKLGQLQRSVESHAEQIGHANNNSRHAKVTTRAIYRGERSELQFEPQLPQPMSTVQMASTSVRRGVIETGSGVTVLPSEQTGVPLSRTRSRFGRP